jgi:hypothetical protein
VGGTIPKGRLRATLTTVDHALDVSWAEASGSPQCPLYDFRAFQSLIGFGDVWAFERKWARFRKACRKGTFRRVN